MSSRRGRRADAAASIVCCAVVASACGSGGGADRPATTKAATSAVVPSVPAAMTSIAAAAETPGQWVRPAGDLSSTRYSDIAEITAERVGALTVKASFATGIAKGHEAAPL